MRVESPDRLVSGSSCLAFGSCTLRVALPLDLCDPTDVVAAGPSDEYIFAVSRGERRLLRWVQDPFQRAATRSEDCAFYYFLFWKAGLCEPDAQSDPKSRPLSSCWGDAAHRCRRATRLKR